MADSWANLMVDGKEMGAKEPLHLIVPAPLYHVAILVAGILVHFLWETLRFFPEPWISHAAGWPLIVPGLLVVNWAVQTMSAAGEDPRPEKPTNTIISTGPFVFSRNPIYLSYTLVYVGIALVVNTIWPILFLPAAIIGIHYGVIIREECYLEGLFSDEYLQYRARVRRWL